MRYAIAGAILALLPVSAYAAPGAVPADAVVISTTPNGQGDPNAWTCRAPQYVTISMKNGRARLGHMGPEVCQTNGFWAALIKNHKTVDETGAVVSLPGYEAGGWGDVGGGVARSEPAFFEVRK